METTKRVLSIGFLTVLLCCFLVLESMAVTAFTITVSSPTSQYYSTAPATLDVTFSEPYFSGWYILNGQTTNICQGTGGSSTRISESTGVAENAWILKGNNDAQIRFEPSMLPPGTHLSAELCFMLYDGFLTEDDSFAFRVNNGPTHLIPDDATFPVGAWVWRCYALQPSELSSGYTVTMWNNNRASNAGFYIGNSNAVANSHSYFNADATNAPGSTDSQIPWTFYGGNTDWAVNLTLGTGGSSCSLTYSLPIASAAGQNQLTVSAQLPDSTISSTTVSYEVMGLKDVVSIPSVVEPNGTTSIRATAVAGPVDSMIANITGPNQENRIQIMYDDGLHMDGAAGDKRYAAVVKPFGVGEHRVTVTLSVQGALIHGYTSFYAQRGFGIRSPANNSIVNASPVTVGIETPVNTSTLSVQVDSLAPTTVCTQSPPRTVAVNFTDGIMQQTWVLSGDNDLRINFRESDLPRAKQLGASFCFYVNDPDGVVEASLDFRVNDGPVHSVADTATSMPVGTWVWVCAPISTSELANSYAVTAWYSNRGGSTGVYIGNDQGNPATVSMWDNSTFNAPSSTNVQIPWFYYANNSNWMISALINTDTYSCQGLQSYPVPVSIGKHKITASAVSAGGTFSASINIEYISAENLTFYPKSVKPGSAITITAVARSSTVTSMTAIVQPPAGNAVQVALFDDGLHNDGGAGDNKFGGSYIPPSAGIYSVAAILRANAGAATTTGVFVANTIRAAVVYSNTTQIYHRNSNDGYEIRYLEGITSLEQELAMAGIPFDVINEVDAMNPYYLQQYNAILFPEFSHVRSADRNIIMNTLADAVRSRGIGIFAFGDFMAYNEANQVYTDAAGASPLTRVFNTQKGTRSSTSANYTVRVVNASHPAAWRYYEGEGLIQFGWHPYQEIVAYNLTEPSASPFQADDASLLENVPITYAGKNGLGRVFYCSSAPAVVQTAMGRDAILFLLYGSQPQFGIKMSNRSTMFTIRVDADVGYDTPQDLLAMSNFKTAMASTGLKGGWYIVNRHSNTSPINWERLTSEYWLLRTSGHEIGSHTMTHPANINILDDGRVFYEFDSSIKELAKILGFPILGVANAGDSPEQERLWWIAQAAGLIYYSPLQFEFTKGFGYIDDKHSIVNLQSNIISDYELMMEFNYTQQQALDQWRNEYNTYYRWGDGILTFILWHDYLLDEIPSLFNSFAQYVASTDAEAVTPLEAATRFNLWNRQDFSVQCSSVTSSCSITRTTPDVRYGQITTQQTITSISGARTIRQTLDNKSLVFEFGSDTVTFSFPQMPLLNAAPANNPPVLWPIPNQVVNESMLVRIVANASDPEGDALTYDINDTRFVKNGNTFTWQTDSSSGNYVFLVSVSDSKAITATTVSVTVLDAQPQAKPLFVMLTTGGSHSCGLLSNGSLMCWGLGSSGQLGTGNTASSIVPAQVASPLTFTQVAAGATHSCAISTTGKVYCWGSGQQGQLGNGANTQQNSPTAVSGSIAFSSITAGRQHTCAIAVNGTGYCWGLGGGGQLGNGATGNKLIPTAVNSSISWQEIQAGYAHTCGITAAGAAYCWGSGTYGQLGNGATTQRNVPWKVNSLNVFTSITAGDYHSCGTAAGGYAYCWGRGNSGQLGYGGTAQQNNPIKVNSSSYFIEIAAGYADTCSIILDGTARCWGSGANGRLGYGGTANQVLPRAVNLTLPFSEISAGQQHSCGITAAGAAYCWGTGTNGRLGYGGTAQQNSPIKVLY